MKEEKFLEFKADLNNSFLKTVSAYSNIGRGVIKFGISDNGEVIGINNIKNFCLNLENKINDSINPKPDYIISPNFYNNTVELIVEEGKYKPYLYKGKAYKRNDTSTIEMDQLELRRLIIESNNLSFEDLENSQDYTFNILAKKLKETLNIELSNAVLKTLGLINTNEKYTNAAAIIADENSFAGIDIIKFGNNINIIQERKTLDHISILKQYDEAFLMFEKYYMYEVIDGQERKQIELIPKDAYREAVANAIIHRIYDDNINIKIAMQEEQVVITSPGGLPYGIKKEEYLEGRLSKLRNPVIANVFFRLKYIEKFGTGILRIKELYKNSTFKPEFIINDNSITIILPTLNKKENVTIDEKSILAVLKNNMLLSSGDITKITNFSKSKTIRLLNSLIKKKIIKVSGDGKNTKYYV